MVGLCHLVQSPIVHTESQFSVGFGDEQDTARPWTGAGLYPSFGNEVLNLLQEFFLF